jgi:hypothetical protein
LSYAPLSKGVNDGYCVSLKFLAAFALSGCRIHHPNDQREIVKLDGRPLIPAGHLGEISADAAEEKASREIAIYRQRRRLEKQAKGEQTLAELLGRATQLVDEKRAKKKR